MWNSFNSPGNENLKPDTDKGLVNSEVDGVKLHSGGHSGNSGASKPCRRPLRLLQVSPHNGESNFEHDINGASSIKRSPLKSLYEGGSNNVISLGNYNQSPAAIIRSPNKNKLTTKNDFSPSAKSIQRISTILVHRQRSDMAVITGTPDRGDSFDRNRVPSSSKSKAARVIESKAVRIRLNGNKKENSIEILGSPNNSCSLLENSMSSPISVKAIVNRRQSQLPKPRSISNSNVKSTGKKANELSMSSFKSPPKKPSSSFREEGASDSKVGFSESLGLFFFSPADTSPKHPVQRPILAHTGEWAAESSAVATNGASSSSTPLSGDLDGNYYTPYTTGAGVSLNRPSMQRSHAKPTLSSASREKDLKRGTPDKAKSARQSPQKSAKFKKLLKVEHPMYVKDSSLSSDRTRLTTKGLSPSRSSAVPLDISSDIAFIPEILSHSDIPSFALCLSPKRARVTLANINAPLSVNWRDTVHSDVEPPVSDAEDIDIVAAGIDALSFRGDLDLGSSYVMKKDCSYETDVSSDESNPQTGLEHVTRVQMRSQNPNPSQRGSPFSFPRQTGGLVGTPSATTAATTKIVHNQKQLIADTANNLTSSINGITRSLAAVDHSSGSRVDQTSVRTSLRHSPVEAETEMDSCRQHVAQVQDIESRGYMGSSFSTGDEGSVENSSLCFSAESCVASSQIFKLPEDSFCKSDYYELIRTAREENTRGVTPAGEPLCAQRSVAQPTSWLSLQSPIDKMQHRGLPKSAVKSRASPQIDLLYTPQPSQPYLRRSASRDKEITFKANGEELEEGEIDEGVCSHVRFTPEVARSSDTLTRCPGLDELLWGPNATSPSEIPMLPNALTFSTANTPLLNRGPFCTLRGGMQGASHSPLNIPFSLGQAESEDCSPTSARPGSRSASLSGMGSAVRLSPQAAQLTEDLAAADALVRMMQTTHLTPSRFDDSRDISNGGPTKDEEEEEEEAGADDSSIFALDCGRDDRHQESECDSESERSQIQEISAVLKNLRDGDVCCRMSSERGQKGDTSEDGEEEEEHVFEVRPLDFAMGMTSSTQEDAAVDRSDEGEAVHAEAPGRALVLRDERLEISTACTEDLDSSALYTTATTISLDFPHDSSYANSSILSTRRAKKEGRSKAGGPQSGPLPNLLVTRKKRRKDAAIEMKEIVLKATPGDSTTVALTFGNSRPGVIVLRPKAILVRYEPSKQAPAPSSVTSQSGRTAGLGVIPGTPQRLTEEDREKSRRQIFAVTPESLSLLPGAENILHVTFSPSVESSGVYSGALKIKAGNKSFVMLLRGEVVLAHTLQHSPSGSGDRCADHIEERKEAPREAKAAQMLTFSQQVSVMTACSPTRDRDLVPDAVQHTRQPTALSPYKSNYEGSISSLDNALTRAMNTSRGVKGYGSVISDATGQQLIDDIELQQDKVRHWLEMEKDRLLGPTLRSASAGGSPRLASRERAPDVMSPEQFRNALKIRTFDSSPSRMVNTQGDGHSRAPAVNESPSRSMSMKGSSSAPLTSRMQAVSPNHLFETSTARRGAWVDERTAHPEKASALAGTHAAERSRRSIGATQTQQHSSGSGRSSSQSRVHYGTAVEEEQFDLDQRERDQVPFTSGLGPSRGAVGAQSMRGAWTHVPQEVRRSPSASLYFRSQVANFGMTAVGTNARQKLELCNSSGEEVTVYIGDCALPFVVLHNEVTLRPRSFVKVAVRFVPVSGPKEFRSQLIAQTADGRQHTEASLYGSSYWA